MSDVPSLEVSGLVKHFSVRSGLLQRQTGTVRAVDGVSFAIRRGETLGLVGESGCGKSTVSRVVLKLIEPTQGKILLGGVDVTRLNPSDMWPHRRHVQIIFQDPYSSLNPRLPASTIVGEPLENFGIATGKEKDDRVASTRTSSPAGSASASASRRRWRSTPKSSWPTSRSRHSTSPCRRRCSTSSSTCRKSTS